MPIAPFFDDVLQDIAYALRSIRKAPAFFSLVIAILALGIGASVSIFSVVDGMLLRPLPYRDPQRLVTLTTYAPRPPFEANGSMSFNDFVQFKAKSRSFSDLAVTFRNGWSRATLTDGYEPIDVQGAFVSPNLFALAGRAPILGRTFTPEEDQRSERVVVISQALWAERFGSSANVLGENLELNHVRWRIIGVAPPDFQLPFLRTQFWAPIHTRMEWQSTDDPNPLGHARWDVLGRLRPGVSIPAAQAEVDAIGNGLRTADEESHSNDVRLVPLREHFSENVRKPLWLLFGAVAFLLVIACANVANLLLARSSERARELAVRTAIGAGRERLFRQLMTEALGITLISGACGAFLAVQLVPFLTRLAPVDTPLIDAVTLNGRGLLFALIVSIATGTVLGLAPAIQLSRKTLNDSLNSGGTRQTETRKDRRLRNLLVAAEFALTMILLTGAGLLLRSFVAVINVDVGFRPANILTAQFSLPEKLNSAQLSRVYESLMQRTAALPNVVAVGGTSNLFYLDERRTHALRLVEGNAPEPQSKWKPLVWTEIAGDYFKAMGIPLMRGRYFGKEDRPDSPVVLIVNQTLARRYWPGQDPIGKRVKGFDARGRHDDWLTVVGVVGDVRAVWNAHLFRRFTSYSRRPTWIP